MLDYAVEKARQLPYEQGCVRIYSVITDTRGRIIGEGSNSYWKTHPLQAFYADQAGLPDKIFLHAEVSAIVRLTYGQEPYKIYIARVDAYGRPCLAAPCPVCNLAIKDHNIKSVEYTV